MDHDNNEKQISVILSCYLPQQTGIVSVCYKNIQFDKKFIENYIIDHFGVQQFRQN